MEPAAVSPSCPRCGADCRAGAARCASCGFALVESAAGSGRSLRRSGGRRGLAAALGLAVAAAATAALLSGGEGEPGAARAAPLAVPALEAEMRLELRFGGADDETAAVRCPRPIERGRIVRCELRYPDGIARAMLVRLSPQGELEADIPYPATLRR